MKNASFAPGSTSLTKMIAGKPNRTQFSAESACILLHRLVWLAQQADGVPVMSSNRSIPRKEQAKLARQLFKQLGLPFIGVTAPDYSMAQAVHLKLPAMRETGHQSIDLLRRLLDRAFPNHNDRSDMQTDHFDYKWSFNTVQFGTRTHVAGGP